MKKTTSGTSPRTTTRRQGEKKVSPLQAVADLIVLYGKLSPRFSLLHGFAADASGATLDLAGDDDASLRAKRNLFRWDAKKKKYVRGPAAAEESGDGNRKRIKTESGVWIPASYKSDRYAMWKERTKTAQAQEADEDDDDDGRGGAKGEI